MDTISRTPTSLATEQAVAPRAAINGSAPHKDNPAACLPSVPGEAASIYEYALWYHRLGFNVVPLERPEKGKTKKPTCKWKGWQTQRQDARDLAALHQRKTRDRERHFAHGILAIDGINDIRHFDLDQVTSYEQAVEPLLAALGLPKDYPWVVQSGSGKGYHICFRCTGDITAYFPGKTGEEPKAVYVGEPRGDHPAFDHVELRWHAALTTLPPSRHWSGGRYTFVNGTPTELPPSIPIDTVIAAFHKVAVLRRAGTALQSDPAAPSALPEVVSTPSTLLPDSQQVSVRWAQAALDKECDELSRARQGCRNEQLNRSAFALGQIVAAGLLTEALVTSRLTTVANALGLDAREIAPTIASRMTAGYAHPRTPSTIGPLAPDAAATSTNAAAVSSGKGGRAKPLIVINGREETEVVEEALAALIAANTPPSLFVRLGRLVRIKRDERGRTSIETMTEPMLRWRLLECATWVKVGAKGDIIHASPPPRVVQDVLALGAWPFPALEGLSELPLVRPDGTIVTEPGYDAPSRMIYAPSPSLRLGPIPEYPGWADVEQALTRVWQAIGEFPYATAADRANALALLLTPLLRYVIKRHVPLALIDAPKQGTGKGLLTDFIAIIATGRTACPMQEPGDDDEWRKAITSLLLRGTSLIVIDNVDHTLHSGRLSSALTLETWGDRLLSTNEIVDIPFKATWIANGNNIRLGGDMGSRSYRIRLDARVSNPSERGGFTHPNLVEYATTHRGEILADLFTIIRYWYVCGEPVKSMPAMRTFSDWASMLGSVLACAGIHEFLGNLAALREEADEHEAEWYAFFNAWHECLGEQFISTKQLVARINGADPDTMTRLAESLPEFLGMARLEKPASFAMRLGKALSKHVDTCFGEENFRLERTRDSHTKLPVWRVVCSGATQQDEPGARAQARDAGDALPPQRNASSTQDALCSPVQADVAGLAGDDMPFQRLVEAGVDPTRRETVEQENHEHQFNKSYEQKFQSPAPPASAQKQSEEGRTATASSSSFGHLDASACTAGSCTEEVGEQMTDSLSKEEVSELVHARLHGVRRVMTPLGPATVWRNWYGDVGVTLDEGQRITRFQDLGDLLAIEPQAEEAWHGEPTARRSALL